MGLSKSVLIVDDHEAIRRTIRALIEDVVDEFFECEDGSLALAAYQQYLPDWVLMDVEMKVMDGLAATRQIIAAHPQACIIIVTKHDNPRLREVARQSGACAFLLKDNLLELRNILHPPFQA